MLNNILVLGGAGYIGSHVVKQLLQQGKSVVVFDNLSKGHRAAVTQGAVWEQGELDDLSGLEQLLKKYHIDAVLHLAALIEVPTSVAQPAVYYHNNFTCCKALLDLMLRLKVHTFVFSSTAATFGNPQYLPIDEQHPQLPCNPYGRSKLMVEWLLRDYHQAYGLNFVALRYFNACGAASDGSLGQSYRPATHLLSAALEVAHGDRAQLQLFGTDYPTPDGSAIRDYIHIEDLAAAHLLALRYLEGGGESEFFNLGSGQGYSVREVIAMVNQVVGKPIQVVESPRRPGDPASLIASNAKAKALLGWQPQRSLEQMVRSAWGWMQQRPY